MEQKKLWTLDQVKNFLGSAIDYYPTASEVGGIVIPVNKEIKAEQKILNFWHVEEILKKSDVIAVGECGCRKSMKNCDKTLEGCLFLNYWADAAIKDGYAKKSNSEEALSILKKTYDEGLVLIAGGEDPPVKICSCCNCCCFLFAGLQQFGIKNSLVRSDFVAEKDKDACDDCGICVSRCHFNAMHQIDSTVSFDQEKCFGCGLCIAACPNNAIQLVKLKTQTNDANDLNDNNPLT